MPCYKCGHPSLIRDDVTGNLVCDSCGTVQKFDNYETRTGGIDGPQGVLVRVGTSGRGGSLNYKDKKIFEANKLIDDITCRLNLSGQKLAEIKSMVSNITDGDYGQGDWFPVLIGACAYTVVRRENKMALSIAEIADLIGCDVPELGRMIARVTDYLNIKLPEFDIVSSFERVVRNLFNLGRIENHIYERMREQGVFLMQCMIKWSLTTGRRPSPIVAAVLVLVAEVNGVEGVKIEDVARDVHAVVSTCKLRYKELLEFLVQVAQVLPWGKDVTVMNVVKNAPFVLRYMEMKSMERCGSDLAGSEYCGAFDLSEAIDRCLRKDEFEYGVEMGIAEGNESRYFQVENGGALEKLGIDEIGKLELSHDCLSTVYNKFLNEVSCGKYREENGRRDTRRKSKRGLELFARDWWNGKSELSKKVYLKQILEKNVGLDPMPPSFVNGCVAVERRKAKINAAKLRIERITNPDNIDSPKPNESSVPQDLHPKKRKRKNKMGKEIDWEDFIIETLLLHQVKEEEIEKGHYNTLLDLHVFNSGVM